MKRYSPVNSKKLGTSITRLIGMALLTLVFSCTLDNLIDVEVPEQLPAIVIEGYLSPGYPIQIAVARNNLMDDELILQPIWNATTYLTDRHDTLFLDNIFSTNSSRKFVFNYIHNSTTQFFQGNHLYLSVFTRQGDTLYAETTRTATVHINSIALADDNLNMGVTADGPFTGYARVDITAYNADTVSSVQSKFMKMPESPNNLQIPVLPGMSMADSLLVKFFHITETYYNYGVSVHNARSAYGDPFLTPEAIRSNITNGIGIFTYYTFDSETVYPALLD
ncbi:MAG: DUF4249 family protein [Bacteroidales bacterium]|nr:DUF4249 family protein [Bacteroidales bacterium]